MPLIQGCVLAALVVLVGPSWACGKDEPRNDATDATDEGVRIVGWHADVLEGEAKRLLAKKDPSAELVSRAARSLRDRLDEAKAAAPAPPLPDTGGVGGRGRGKPGQQQVKTAVVSVGEFLKTYAAAYPREANLARAGRATASSTHSDMDEPITALGGVRKRDTWAMRGGKGWFLAEWPQPLSGRYVLLFNRPPGGADAWDSGVLEINGRSVARIGSFTRGQVLVVDLGEPVAIKSVKVLIEGQDNPGLNGLEIHRGARR
jgi:hypothetical protein